MSRPDRTRATPIPRTQQAGFVAAFRRHYAAVLETIDPFRDVDLRGPFDRVCLLPLQVSDWYGFGEQVTYRTQFEFLIDVLSATPPDVRVVVTEYPDWGPVIKQSGPERSTPIVRPRNSWCRESMACGACRRTSPIMRCFSVACSARRRPRILPGFPIRRNLPSFSKSSGGCPRRARCLSGLATRALHRATSVVERGCLAR
jgi:hypothetical protein